MTFNHHNKFNRPLLMLHLLVAGALALAACQPIVDTGTGETPSALATASEEDPADDSVTESSADSATDAVTDTVTDAVTTEGAAEEADETDANDAAQDAEVLLEPAMATITTRSLRVREAPDSDSEVVAGAREDESYPVIAISADGAWVQIEIDRSETGEGWVSTNFISLEGDITETETAPVAQPPTQPRTTTSELGEFDGPSATIDTRSLRVRAEPQEDGEIIAGLNLGDSFNVLGISADGIWILLELSEIEEEEGWVQANFVRLTGDLTAIPTLGEVAEEDEATEDATEDATVAVTDEDANDEESSAEDTAEEVTDEDVTDEDVADEDVADEDVADEDVADEDVADEDVADEDVADEDVADEDVADETVEDMDDLPFTTATVNTRSLFVREAPDAASDPVAGAREGESYVVIGVSDDGLWVEIETERSETGVGWVAAEFVTLE